MNSKISYNLSADIVRIIAILGVVIIHTTNAVYTRPDFLGGTTWWITIVLDSISRISVPLFIMLSGYLVLRKNESLNQSIGRIFSRITIPLLFWLIFYTWLGTGIPSANHVNSSIIQKLFFADVYHLYYLVILIGLYIVSPLIKAYLLNVTQLAETYFVKILLIFGVVEVGLQFVFQGCLSQNFFTWWAPFTGLFAAGYVLGGKTQKFSVYKLGVGYCLGVIVTLSLNFLYFHHQIDKYKFLSSAGCLSHYSDHFLSINVVVMSICAFLILMKLKYRFIQKNNILSALVKSLSKSAFGIYLIHPAIARFLEIQFHLAVDFSSLPIAIIIFLKLSLVFLISYFITTIALRIPVLKYIFGEKAKIPGFI